jgi:hypothetical protein
MASDITGYSFFGPAMLPSPLADGCRRSDLWERRLNTGHNRALKMARYRHDVIIADIAFCEILAHNRFHGTSAS